ncbi:MAG: hypothetical protein ACUVQ0_06110, partial [Thermoproteota archaeon]
KIKRNSCKSYAYVVPGGLDKDRESARIFQRFFENVKLPRREAVRLKEYIRSIIPGRHCKAYLVQTLS